MLEWNPRVQDLIRLALAEDLDTWDLTSALLPADALARGRFVAKAPGVLAGGALIEAVFHEMGAPVVVRDVLPDGSELEPGSVIAIAKGPLRALLVAERTILNFLMRLSGVATATRHLVSLVEGTRARVVDTRKTTPGWRALEKHAVLAGGGLNHRHSLAGGVLVKNNHVDAAGGVREAVEGARRVTPITARVEIEVRDEHELDEALAAGADLVMLDHFTPEAMRAAVARVAGRVPLEASGNVTAATIRAVAETGVDYISVGALTHSSPALDLAFRLVH